MPPKRKPKKPDREKEAVGVVLRFLDALNSRDFDTMRSLIDEKHIDHTYFGRDPVSPDAIVRMIGGHLEKFPDWHETVDDIVASRDGTVTIYQTGRGTQEEEDPLVNALGRQIAVPLVTTVKVRNGRITEYRSTFPWTRPEEEQINAADDIQHARAEQGGRRLSLEDWRGVLSEYEEGRIDEETLTARRAEVSAPEARCQTLLEATGRRCQNPALPGSLYCGVHQEPGAGGGIGRRE